MECERGLDRVDIHVGQSRTFERVPAKVPFWPRTALEIPDALKDAGRGSQLRAGGDGLPKAGVFGWS